MRPTGSVCIALPQCFVAASLLLGSVLAQPSAADSGLNGCLYWLDATAQAWTAEQWKEQIGFMQQAGLRHVIAVGPAIPAAAGWDPADPMIQTADRLMAACAGSDLRIYLSLSSHPQWYGRWDLEEELSTNRRVVERLAERYGRHPNFAGWYIPHEIYVVWGKQADYITGLYAGLSRICKQAAPQAKVVVSPFFILDREGYLGDFRFAEPAEYESFWYELLRQTQIDVVALQDSGEHLSCYTMEQRQPFFAAMKRACTRAGKTLWINIETGELHVESLADYERKFGRKTHVNDAKTQRHWRVVPPDKLRRKLALARAFADTTITWGYREYWDPMRGPAARDAFKAYAAMTPAASAPVTDPRPAAEPPGPQSP